MKPVHVSFIILLLATCLYAQDPAPTSEACPDIQVQNFEWGVTHRTKATEDPIFKADSSGRRMNTRDNPINTLGNPVNTVGVPMGTNPVRPQGDPPTRDPGFGNTESIENVQVRRETYMLVKNVGPKIIKRIDWDYVFFKDAEMQQELKRRQYHSKKKIAPGESKFVSEYTEDRAPSRFQAVVINRVEFTDGSIWQK